MFSKRCNQERLSGKKQTCMSRYHETVQVSGGQNELILQSVSHLHILHETSKAETND